jgi:hypothetical protein
LWRADYAVTTLKRWPLGTAYLDIVGQLVRFFETLPPEGWPLLVMDATGVGEAVVEAAVRAMKGERSRGGWAAVTITDDDLVLAAALAVWAAERGLAYQKLPRAAPPPRLAAVRR